MDMKKIGLKMSIMMGVTLSFCLSLIGNLTSGHFTLPGFLISFAASTVISLIIGFLVPMKKVGDAVCGKFGLKPRTIPARLVEALISDLIYTPFITFAMVLLAYITATSQGAQMNFLPMFLSSLIISLLAAYVIIFFITPVYMKLAMKGAVPPHGPDEHGGHNGQG